MVYLIHYFMIGVLVWIHRWGLPSLNQSVDALIMAIITILLAALSWKFFEKPINNLKRFFPYSNRL